MLYVLFFQFILMGLAVGSLADVWSIRHEDRSMRRKEILECIKEADLIVAGTISKALKWDYGVWKTPQDKEINGYWHEVLFMVDGVIKDDRIPHPDEVKIRFFMSADRSSRIFFHHIPNEGRCVVFLDGTTATDSEYRMIPNNQTVLRLPESMPDLNGYQVAEDRLAFVLRNAVEAGITDEAVIETLLYLTDEKEWRQLLQDMSNKAAEGTRGVLLAYRMSLGDMRAVIDVDKLLGSGKLSSTEASVIATALAELKMPELKSYLLKWRLCEDKMINKSAWQTLVAFREKDMVPILISALDHEDSLVRLRSLHSLSKIEGTREKEGKPIIFTHDDHHEAVAAWKKWWLENGKARYQR